MDKISPAASVLSKVVLVGTGAVLTEARLRSGIAAGLDWISRRLRSTGRIRRLVECGGWCKMSLFDRRHDRGGARALADACGSGL